MKWLVGLLLAGIVVFVALGIIANKRYDASREARQAEEIQKPVATPEAAPAPGVANPTVESTPQPMADSEPGTETEAVDLDRLFVDDKATTGESLPQAATIIGTDKPVQILEAARLFTIDLAGIQTVPGGANINISWTGDEETRGSEFLAELKKRALIASYNLDESVVDYRFDKGQKLWTAKYRVAF